MLARLCGMALAVARALAPALSHGVAGTVFTARF